LHVSLPLWILDARICGMLSTCTIANCFKTQRLPNNHRQHLISERTFDLGERRTKRSARVRVFLSMVSTCKPPCPKSHFIGPLYSAVDYLTRLLRKSKALSDMAQMPLTTLRPVSFCKACLIFLELIGLWAAHSSTKKYTFQPGSDTLSQYPTCLTLGIARHH